MTRARMGFSGLAFLVFLMMASVILLAGCGGDDDDDDSGDDTADDDSAGDDDASGPVDDNAREEAPEALVVTTQDMRAVWEDYADWKDRTGIRTDVVTVDDVLLQDASDFESLWIYLRDRADQGVRYVLLGGDADQIPYLRGYSEVWALEDYYGNAPIETYFEDLDADWDKDGDGTYGEEDEDVTVEDLRNPVVAVGRVPVQTADEARGYVDKVIRYESGEGSVADRATAPLFLADVAASVPIVGDIDGGMMHEQLIADYIPDFMQAQMRRLYGTPLYADYVGAEVGTQELIRQAYEDQGYTYTVTNTHGSYEWLTLLMNRYFVRNLTNEVPFIFVTTSCLSGNFADRANANGDNPRQEGVNDDSVAEELVKNPNGGAVAYVGNTLIGLGPVGGVQFNHSLTRSIFVEGYRVLGDAMMNARATLWSEVASVTVEDLTVNFPMTFFPGTEWYTQRSVLLMGDPALRVWTAAPSVLGLDAPSTYKPGYNVIDVSVTRDGAAAANVPVALSELGGPLVRHSTDSQGRATFMVELSGDAPVTITAYDDNAVADEVALTAE